MNRFQFNPSQQDLIKRNVAEEEAVHGPMSICQLYENDTLFLLLNIDMPENLGEIDFDFLSNPFE